MKDKLELQKQYIEVKKKYDELSEKYWSSSYMTRENEEVKKAVYECFILLKSLNKQIYYER